MVEKILNKIWKNPPIRYLFVLITSAIADFWISLYSYSVAHGWILTQALVGFGLPFVNIVFYMWFTDVKDFKERLRLTLFSAFGLVIGSTSMLLLFHK